MLLAYESSVESRMSNKYISVVRSERICMNAKVCYEDYMIGRVVDVERRKSDNKYLVTIRLLPQIINYRSLFQSTKNLYFDI